MKCFVIMPFAKMFNDVYDTIKNATENAIPGELLSCTRLDEVRGAGRITDDLLDQLTNSDFCIADITDSNPNVMWEVGYGMALRKPIVFISQSVQSLPFDIKDMRVTPYDRNDLSKTLRGPLRDEIRDTLAKYQIQRQKVILKRAPPKEYAIAITGSSNINPQRAARRLPEILRPYLGAHALWYCGSSGAADEATIDFLTQAGERVIVVGYHQYDISDRILELMQQHDLHFVDAQQESLIGGIEPTTSTRDLFFASRANLVILLWNRKSRGVAKMVEWFKTNAKDFMLCFSQ